ncbi:MAG TPA: hypothetical protein VNJ54_04805 [Plantibacter sp.]|nr:hypothetical protein [Plantibacter sp.]
MRVSLIGKAITIMMSSFLLAGCTHPEAPAGTGATGEALSLSPASDAVYACITEKGWDVTISWDGGIGASSDTIPAAQVDQYDSDAAACWAMIDDRVAAMQPDEIEAVYLDEIATRECLIAQGYSVDSPPSRQQYVDTFFTTRWTAYGESDAMSPRNDEDTWRALNETCPQPAWSLGL